MELEQYEIEQLKILEDVSKECPLFLKRDNNSFPLKEVDKIALYGNGVRHIVKGGTGSGNVNIHIFNDVEKAFKKAGFEVTTKSWLDKYDELRKKAKEEFIDGIRKDAKKEKRNIVSYSIGHNLKEFEYDIPHQMECDTAIYVLSRIAGEGKDRTLSKGDFYLTDTEIKNIISLNKEYKNFLLVLNVSSVIDITPVLEVDNILLLSQIGSLTSETLVNIVLGKANPSGKLSDTWAKYEDYPFNNEFGSWDDVYYKEDIFVGYRYFDTFDIKPIFEFGYGKSYSEFEIKFIDAKQNKDEFIVSAEVKNISEYTGKEVVQLYLESSISGINYKQRLVSFVKTKEIKPNEKCLINLRFSLRDFPSFNGVDSYYLQKGIYRLNLGNSSRNNIPVCSIEIKEDIILKKVNTSIGNDVHFDELTPLENSLGKLDLNFEINKDDLPKLEECSYSLYKEPLHPSAEKMSNDELILVSMGDIKKGIEGMVGQSCSQVLGGAGETYLKYDKSLSMADGPAGLRITKEYIKTKNGKVYKTVTDQLFKDVAEFLPKIVAPLILNERNKKKKGTIYHQYTTSIPVATALAQSFNMDVLKECGDIVRREMEMFNVDLWLAPAMNIHRHVLCGRNFEYYSEDPLLSGLCALAITKAVQSNPKKGVVIKHFACNNQETNRTNSNSILSSRALREIYLYGFEKVIKEGNPVALMVSYNLINGKHTTEDYELLNDIVRCEYGYKGLLMTDWYVTGQIAIRKNNKYPYSEAYKNLNAGINLCMPGGKGDIKNIKSALKAKKISRETLLNNVSIVLNCVDKFK